MFLVHHRYSCVPLAHSFASGHLGRLVVGAIRLPNSATHASPHLRLGLEPSADLLGLVLEALHWAGFTCTQRRLTGVGEALLAMARQPPPHRTLHLLGFPLELFAPAASRLGGIAGKLNAIDGKQLPSDQPVPVTDHHHSGKELTEGLTSSADKRSQCSEMRRGPSADGPDEDILLTRTFHHTGTHQGARIGYEDNLEQQGRGVSWRSPLVVTETLVKLTEVPLVVNHITQGIFEGAWQKLTSEIHAPKLRTHINWLITGHRVSLDERQMLPRPCSQRRFSASVRQVFLQPQRSRSPFAAPTETIHVHSDTQAGGNTVERWVRGLPRLLLSEKAPPDCLIGWQIWPTELMIRNPRRILGD